jgi:hypothetical protein
LVAGRESSVTLLNREIAVLYDNTATGFPHVVLAKRRDADAARCAGIAFFQNTWFKHGFAISRLETPEVCL